jgi:hypothetical protein
MVVNKYQYKSTTCRKKMPELISFNLDLHPFARSFWTDDEMFAVTGATSIALIKLMQRQKLLTPGRYKNSAGKLSRAWKAEELFRIALAIDFSDQTGFSAAATAAILGAMGADCIDHALSTKDALAEIDSRFRNAREIDSNVDEQGLPPSWNGVSLTIERPVKCRIRIVDREFIHLVEFDVDCDHEDIHETPQFGLRPLGRLVDAKTNSPFVESYVSIGMKPGDASEPDLSILEVHLECLALSPYENRAFGIDVIPTFPIG